MTGFSWFDLVISNTGTCRATDISVDIEIPDGLEIYETIDIDMLTRISIPNNKRPGEKPYPAELPGLRQREGREEFPEKLISLPQINGWDVVEGKAEISIDEIRHYSEKRCIEFFIVGVKPGKYTIPCKIMCAEYSEPEYQELSVEVE
jgi:hypothetical protein